MISEREREASLSVKLKGKLRDVSHEFFSKFEYESLTLSLRQSSIPHVAYDWSSIATYTENDEIFRQRAFLGRYIEIIKNTELHYVKPILFIYSYSVLNCYCTKNLTVPLSFIS